MMGKNPAFLFYPGDWLRDPQLQMASHQTKGIWIDLLCRMWDAPSRGKLTGTVEQFCKLLSCSEGQMEEFLSEAKQLNFANVMECNEIVTVCNRRMMKDEKEKEDTRLRVKKHRDKKQSNASVTNSYNLLSVSVSDSVTDSVSKEDKKAPIGEHKEDLVNNSKDKRLGFAGSDYRQTYDDIKDRAVTLYQMHGFKKVDAFVNTCIKKGKNPGAILHALNQCIKKHPDDPWSYCCSIVAVENGNYNEREYEHQPPFKEGTLKELMK